MGRLTGYPALLTCLLCTALAVSFLTVNRIKTRHEIGETAALMTGGKLDRAPAIFRRYGCAGCHTIPGVPGADGQVGPALSGLRARVYIAGTLPNNAENARRWIVGPEQYAQGTAMPASGISPDEARDLVAYLYTH